MQKYRAFAGDTDKYLNKHIYKLNSHGINYSDLNDILSDIKIFNILAHVCQNTQSDFVILLSSAEAAALNKLFLDCLRYRNPQAKICETNKTEFFEDRFRERANEDEDNENSEYLHTKTCHQVNWMLTPEGYWKEFHQEKGAETTDSITWHKVKYAYMSQLSQDSAHCAADFAEMANAF